MPKSEKSNFNVRFKKTDLDSSIVKSQALIKGFLTRK